MSQPAPPTAPAVNAVELKIGVDQINRRVVLQSNIPVQNLIWEPEAAINVAIQLLQNAQAAKALIEKSPLWTPPPVAS